MSASIISLENREIILHLLTVVLYFLAMMITDYGYAGLFFVFGIAFVSAAFIISWFLRPRDPNPMKRSVYECGEIVKGHAQIRFNVSYYLVALLFVIFDIEVLFLVPWALVFRDLGMVGYVEMMLFILILVFGLLYAVKKGVFKWR